MIQGANARTIWLAAAATYLALQPAWDYLVIWASTWAGWPGRWVTAVRGWRFAQLLRMAGQILYYLAIPYAALFAGVADARGLGLVGMPRWPELPVGTAVGLASVVLVAWLWGRLAAVSYRRGAGPRLLVKQRQLLASPWGWAQLLGQVLCLQVSWAFVRGAAIGWLGLYPGAFAGLALTAVAWILRPSTRARLAGSEARARALLQADLALISSLVFVYTENLWLCATIHCLGLLWATLAAGRAYRGTQAEAGE